MLTIISKPNKCSYKIIEKLVLLYYNTNKLRT